MVGRAEVGALETSGAPQLELVWPGLSAQLVGVKLPPVGLLLKLTVPRGADFFFFNDTATTEIYTLSLHDALPISAQLTTVVVVRRRTFTSVVPVLVAWLSPRAGL